MKKIWAILLLLHCTAYALGPLDLNIDGDLYHKNNDTMWAQKYTYFKDSVSYAANAGNALTLNGYSSSWFASKYDLASATSSISGGSGVNQFSLLIDSVSSINYIVRTATNSVPAPPDLTPYLTTTTAINTYYTKSSGTVDQTNIYNLQLSTYPQSSIQINASQINAGTNAGLIVGTAGTCTGNAATATTATTANGLSTGNYINDIKVSTAIYANNSALLNSFSASQISSTQTVSQLSIDTATIAGKSYAYLPTTQTFTGQNTFNGLITINSSATVLNSLAIGTAIPAWCIDAITPLSNGLSIQQSGVYDNKNATMQSNTTPAPFAVTASGNVNGSRLPWNAFDNNTATGWISNASLPCWLEYDFGYGNSYTITRYTMIGINTLVPEPDLAPKSWTLRGSNDDTNWVWLDTQTSVAQWATGEKRTYDFVNTTSYRYYRLYGSAAQVGPYFSVVEMTLQNNNATIIQANNNSISFGARTSTATLAASNGYLTLAGNTLGNGTITGLNQLILSMTGGLYGGVNLCLLNQANQVGVLLSAPSTFGYHFTDLMFADGLSPSVYRTIRFSNGTTFTGNLPETQIGDIGNGNNPTLVIADTTTYVRRGSLGVGNANPKYTFDVIGNVHITTTSVAGSGIYMPYGGNVGIGISNPTANLYVVGTSTVTGDTYVGGNLTLGGVITGNGTGITGITAVDNAVRVSTGIIQSQLSSSTGTLATSVYNIGQATGTLATSVYNLQIATGTIQTQLTNVAFSTGTLDTLGTNQTISGVKTFTSSVTINTTGINYSLQLSSGLYVNATAGGRSQNLIVCSTGTTNVFRVRSAAPSVFGIGAFATTGADYAEVYLSDGSCSPGDVVYISANGKVSKANRRHKNIIGVVSTAPGYVIGWLGVDVDTLPKEYSQIALIGRTPVNFSNENGKIRCGDPVCLSNKLSGAVMKCNKSSRIVGFALQDSENRQGKITIFVQPGYYNEE